MRPRIRKNRIPTDLMDRLHVAAVVASEQVFDEHVRSAVELVEEGAGRAPAQRLIATYARLHHIRGQEARKLHGRVLSALGDAVGDLGPLLPPRSPLARLLRRLRGRTNPELRAWVEQHTARSELSVLDIHVDNALAMVRLAGDHASDRELVAFYADALELRPAVAEMVELRVLKTLYDRGTGQVEPLRPEAAGSIPLRVSDNQR